MLLRRVIAHVKAQNWTAVALDFVIVVVGVYIGIYLGDIQDARNYAGQTQQSLAAVEFELRSDLNQLDDVIAIQEKLVLGQRRAIELLGDASHDPEELGRLLIYITQENDTFFPNRAAYEAMKTGGHLSALPDNTLRLQIANLFERHVVRVELNATLYDEVGFDFMRDIRDPNWDAIGHRPIGDGETGYILMRNGVRTLLDQSEFYLRLLKETIRPEYQRTLAMIDGYQEK